ncbi:MAG: nitrate reductase cytochrome c-type subunit [Rhodoferax sp.]|jgi:cytochrome c-type protein NapB|nr:nitrate reductase cytochrome c-type subunit [Rhodoferax sp.]
MKTKHFRLALATLTAVVFSVGCAVSQDHIAYEKVNSMRGTDVAVADAPFEAKTYQGKKPGQQQLVVRTFNGQPPVIPHTLDNFDEITLEDNQCIECHGLAKFKEKGAPKMAESHFVDQKVAMTRWQCNTCHVPQVDAAPLVKLNFVGSAVPKL